MEIPKHLPEEAIVETLFTKCEFAKNYAERNNLTHNEINKTKVSDFDVDSLDNAEFVMGLEDRFEIDLGENAMERIYNMTIEEVTAEVNKAIEEQG